MTLAQRAAVHTFRRMPLTHDYTVMGEAFNRAWLAGYRAAQRDARRRPSVDEQVLNTALLAPFANGRSPALQSRFARREATIHVWNPVFFGDRVQVAGTPGAGSVELQMTSACVTCRAQVCVDDLIFAMREVCGD